MPKQSVSSPLTRSGMRGEIRFDQSLGTHVRIYLRGGDAGMAQQFLYGAHVRTALNQMSGERMPQRMRMQRLGDVGPLPRCFDDFPYRLP